MCYESVLEQFLLLSDLAFNNILIIILQQINNIIVLLPIQSIIEILGLPYYLTDILFYHDLIWRLSFSHIISQIYDLYDNVIFNLINLQYYKLNFFLIFFVSSMAFYTTLLFPKTIFQLLIERSHIMAQQILKPIFGSHYPFTVRFYQYYPFLYHLFLFILFNNLLGLVPYGFSNSAYIIHNLVLSMICLIGLTLVGISIQGVDYYKLFIPKNVPTYLIPFLMLIELISHIAKAFSLAIRLFANIMSSHILLHILAGFALKILDFNVIIGLIPCILILAIVFLEIGIAFLQAYVFTVLLAIYFEETFILLHYTPKLETNEHKPFVLEEDFNYFYSKTEIN